MKDEYGFTPCETVAKRCAQLGAEYVQAVDMICAGSLIPLNDGLRQSLHRIAEAIQGALDDGATLVLDDLALLCAAETTERFKERIVPSRNDYAHTLFILSQAMFS